MKQVKAMMLTNMFEQRDHASMTEFERQLVDDAKRAMEAPSPQLRERTLDSLRSQPVAMAVSTRRWMLPALAACLLMTLSAGIASLMLTPVSPIMTARTRLNLTLPMTGAPNFSEPLLNEARLLARDAQRTIARFKEGLPSPPKFDHAELGAGSAS
jgi:hypothetical protein